MESSRQRGRFRAVLFLCVICMLSTACIKVGPDFARPGAQISSGWTEAGDKRVKDSPADYRAWWKEFDDPALDRIIERAYAQNLTLRAAGVRVLEARAQLGIAIGSLYPQTQQLGGAFNFNRTSEFSAAAAAGSQMGIQQQHSYWTNQLNLNVGWEIDFWGRFRRAVEAADAGLLAAVADYDSTLVSLTADAASSYINIRTLAKRLEIARQNAQTQQESLRIAQARFQGGVTSERDVEQARTVLYNTLSTIPTLEARLRQAKNALSLLMGMPPDELTGFLAEGHGEIPAPPVQVAIGIPSELLRRRPDIRNAEFLAAAQSARIGIAKAELLPAFSLTGTIGLQASSVEKFNLADIASLGAGNVTAGPAFRWNIFNYGRLTNNVRVEDARFQELLISYQNTVLRAQQEVEDSLSGFLRAQESAEHLSKSAEAARRSLDLAFIQYTQGSTDFTTVLTAQQALLTAQDSLAAAIGSIAVNLVGLYRTLGGGWQIREGKDFVPDEVKEAMARRTNWGNLLTPAAHIPDEKKKPEVRFPDW